LIGASVDGCADEREEFAACAVGGDDACGAHGVDDQVVGDDGRGLGEVLAHVDISDDFPETRWWRLVLDA